jgi:hypothetical protein
MEGKLGEVDFGAHTLRHKVTGIVVQCTPGLKVAWIGNADIERRTGCVGAADAINEEWI